MKVLNTALMRLPLDVRDRIAQESLQSFLLEEDCQLELQLLAEEEQIFVLMIALRLFANAEWRQNGADATHHQQHTRFVKTALQLGKTIAIPLHEQWAHKVRNLSNVHHNALARKQFLLLITDILPQAEKSDGRLIGLVEDVVNAQVSLSLGMSRTALHVSASMGDVDLVNALLHCKARVDVMDSSGNTVFHLGVNHPLCVKALLGAPVQPQRLEHVLQRTNNALQTALLLCDDAESAKLLLDVCPSLLFAADRHRNTPLHLRMNNPTMVAVLLNAAEKLGHVERITNEVNSSHNTALHLCTHVESITLLLGASPASAFAKDRAGNTVLHLQVNSINMVKVILKAAAADIKMGQIVEQVNERGEIVLHHCINVECAKMLLCASPRLLLLADKSGNTALHARVNDCDMVKLLLETASLHGLKLADQVNSKGQIALHLCRNVESAKHLLSASPNSFRAKCSKGNTPLHVAAMLGEAQVCRLLLDAEVAGEDMNATNSAEQTPLHLAARFQRKEVVLLLLAKSAQVLARDDRQRTVLHYAVLNLRDEVLDTCLGGLGRERLLWEDRRQVDWLYALDDALLKELLAARDDTGQTVMHYCALVSNISLAVVDKLMLAGADAKAQDENGDTAIHLACLEGCFAFTKHLIKHWAIYPCVKNYCGETPLDGLDARRRAELLRMGELSTMATLCLARRANSQSPWKRFPVELFRELCGHFL